MALVANIAGRDKSSTTGINLANIQAETGLNPWTATQREVRLKLNEQEVEVPHTDLWRLPYLQKLLAQRHDIEVNCGKTTEINKIITSLCTT